MKQLIAEEITLYQQKHETLKSELHAMQRKIELLKQIENDFLRLHDELFVRWCGLDIEELNRLSVQCGFIAEHYADRSDSNPILNQIWALIDPVECPRLKSRVFK